MSNKLDSFFKSYADTDEQLNYSMANETVGEKVPSISTGSLVLDDALSSGGLPKGRLIQYYGPPGCHAKGQGILMANSDIKKVEDIQLNDVLMGPDSTPRKVLALLRGKDKMFKITPIKGESFIVNENHILTLIRNNNKLKKSFKVKYELIDVKLGDYLNWSNTQKSAHKLVRAKVDDFYNSYSLNSKISNKIPLDPYILGVLLGDGALQNSVEITSGDQEIVSAFKEFTNNSNLNFFEGAFSGNSRVYRASGIKFKENYIFSIIKNLGINVTSGYKFIPQIYKSSSIKNRALILAGLLDTDGSYANGGFDYISKSQKLSNDVAFIARSLGLAAYVNSCIKSAHKNHSDTYYRVSISGDCTIIPTKIARKQAEPRKQIKNVLYTGFEIEYVGVDDYYGFTLSDDGRYLLDDFTITHNSGKTLMAMIAILNAQKEDPTSLQMFIDAEQTFDPNWAESLGVDTSRIVHVKDDLAANGRKCFEMLLGVPKEDQKHVLKGKSKEGFLDKIISKEINVNLIVLDSLGSLIPPGEDTAVIGKMNMALLARFLTTTFKKLTLELNKANVPFIIINHKKDNMDPYGSDHTYSGGNTYTHTLSANVYFEAVQRKDAMILDEKENKVGHPLRATVEKSKFGPWPRKCEFKVNFSQGVIDIHEEIANLALEYDVVQKTSTVAHEYGDKKWIGFAKFSTAIQEDPIFAEELKEKIEVARTLKMETKRLEQVQKREALNALLDKSAKKEVAEEVVEKKRKKDKNEQE